MRLAIRHEIAWTWDTPPRSVIQHLRIEPRNHEGQHIIGWRMDVEPDGRRRMGEDAFGNAFESLTVDGPLSTLTVRADGELETFDTTGIVRYSIERFAPDLFLRESTLTAADAALRDFANSVSGREGASLARAHALMDALHERLDHAACRSDEFAGAAKTFSAGRGHARDIAHVFIACARSLGIPARIAVGHLFAESDEERACMHGWAELYIYDLGWIGFDPVTGRCPEGGHIRVAIGIDAIDALPVRGAHHGGAAEKIVHRIAVRLTTGR
ncbi:MAG: transglutaminase family protein [Methylobacteriaceae bacterium]|nr:transglutaminase family protein [Methylobacteriaceae bacterium]